MPDVLTPDGTLQFTGGQNAALDPDKIREDQFALGINVSIESGSLTPRWGIHQDELDFSGVGSYKRSTSFEVSFEQIFYTGKFQAFIPYRIGPDRFSIFVVSGFVYLVNLQDFTVQVLNPTDPANLYADRVAWSPAGDYLEIADYPFLPFILDGVELRRSDPTEQETPVCYLLTYNQSRVMIANGGIDWTASDPQGLTPTAPLTFTEILTPSSPFVADVYQIPTASKYDGSITAMGYLQVLDRSTEIGSLLIATENSITAYPTFLPRNQWIGTAASQVFGSILLSTGIAGQRAQVNVNSDLIFKAPDGQIYALTMARNDQGKWSNTPISREVKNFLSSEPELNQFTVASYFRNKIFVSGVPYRINVSSYEGFPQTDYAHAALLVIESDAMGTLTTQTPPAWAGAWSGLEFQDLTEINGKLYIAGRRNGKLGLYHFEPELHYDVFDGVRHPIRSVIETREYPTQDPTINKEIHSMELGLREVKDKVTISTEFKSSVINQFLPWKTFEFTAPYSQCEVLLDPNGLLPQGVRDLNIGGIVAGPCGPDQKSLLEYKTCQARLVIEGFGWKIKYLKLFSVVKQQSANNPRCFALPPRVFSRQCFPYFTFTGACK